MTTTYLSNLAALTSGNLEELADLLPEEAAIAAELRSVAAKLDKLFSLRTIRLPIE